MSIVQNIISKLIALTASLALVLTIVSPAYSDVHENGEQEVSFLQVESCLLQSTSTFRFRITNIGFTGTHRLRSTADNSIAWTDSLNFNQTVGSFNDNTITTQTEATWAQEFDNTSSWIDAGGTHTTSIAGHIRAGDLCPEDPSPTPDPDDKGREAMLNGETTCGSDTFNAVMNLSDDGRGLENLTVRFSYNGITKEGTTNKDGRASTSFDFADTDALTATALGFNDQGTQVQKPDNCPVLATTTLASTGSQEELTTIGMIVGFMLIATSGYGITKYSTKQA